MKNILSILTIVFIAAVICSSCKKENVTNTSTIRDTTYINDTINVNDSVKTNTIFRFKDTITTIDTVVRPITIVGFYTGKIGNNTDYPSFQMAFLFRNDGTVRVYNNNISTPGYFDTSLIPPSEGTYTVVGSTVVTNCAYVSNPSNTFSTLGTLDSAFTYMDGSWGYGTATSGGGYYFSYKQY